MGILSFLKSVFSNDTANNADVQGSAPKMTLKGGEVYVNPAVPSTVKRNQERIKRLKIALENTPETHPNYKLYLDELKRREASLDRR